ncbi:glycosyltransferase family 2 protein [Paenibacillus senegalensis]|uniref:glycosyltransferase family 2 protein n=1 Tax=Paenibacillus senegalensis TaxID=1465766 RepID=UPI000288FD48|nr:glycosyltransferase family 2 protein [Paenibacillus senegalensis]
MVGIIILNYIAYKETIKCTRSIMETYSGPYRIYIIDNDSKNGSYNKLTKEFASYSNIRIIKNDKNSGYSAGNNIGIKQAIKDDCEYILISNSDIIFHPNSIEEMHKFIGSHENVGIVGPKILNKAGGVEIKSRMFSKTGIREKLFARTKLRAFNYKGIYRNYYGLDKSFDEPIEVYALSGCCFMMSKKIAKLITPLDENTFLYEEEVIIGIRAEKTGFKTYYVPDSVVTHYHAVSSKYIGAFSLIHLVNSEIYYCKSYLKLKSVHILPIYLFRVALYISRCFKDSNYRRNAIVFLKQTQNRLWSKDGLGKVGGG